MSSRACRLLHVAAALSAGLTIVVVSSVPALAHEPLWGETPTIFGPGVFHPEIRFGFVRRGDNPDPGEESWEDFEQEYGLQYGVNRFVNVRLTLPVMHSEVEQNSAGAVDEALVTGLGDAILEAKYRYHLRQETGVQRSQAISFGWKIPTGDDDHTAPDGSRLPPSQQPGTGRHGVKIGWAADIEHLTDTTWGGFQYGHDLGGTFRKGDTFAADAAYGRWVVRPNTGDDLGVMLAFGVHGEGAASDQLEDGSSARNSYRVAGIQMTPIITKGRAQYRVGIFVPLARGGDDEMTDFPYELRAGWEMFF
jgi:hypothetical protein